MGINSNYQQRFIQKRMAKMKWKSALTEDLMSLIQMNKDQ